MTKTNHRIGKLAEDQLEALEISRHANGAGLHEGPSDSDHVNIVDIDAEITSVAASCGECGDSSSKTWVAL